MSPFRGDVVGVSLLFALPVLALTIRGDLSPDDLTTRMPWCFLAGWLVVSVVRFALRPPAPAPTRPARRPTHSARREPTDDPTTPDPAA